MAKFTLDYTGEQINEALGLALNGSADALKKTGDTMEGVLKFTPDVHYGASLPETGETGQIYFVEAEEAFLENKDGVVKTSNVNDKAITRAKLANNALYSPMVSSAASEAYSFTVDDLGKTVAPSYTAASVDVVYTMTEAVSAALPYGAEIAICYRYGNSLKIKFEGGAYSAIAGDTAFNANRIYEIPDRFSMVAIKKIDTGTEKQYWLVTGNVEVVS